jgi:SAM-dependent methyltransferase
MPSPERLIEPRLVALHKARAARRPREAVFLHARAADDLAERLEAIPRRFARVLTLGGGPAMRAALDARPALRSRIGEVAHADATPMPGGVAVDADLLPFAEASFNLVLSPLFLHWTNDLVGALTQLRRALRPDGLLLATLFGGETLRELRAALIAAELEVRGGAAARIAPFGEVMELAHLLQRAGLALPASDRDVVTVRYASVLALMRDLRAMGETNALGARAPLGLNRAVLLRLDQIYRERFADGDSVRATFELITLTGWAPHASQQKPLAPGSARARLADALGATERSAGETAGG